MTLPRNWWRDKELLAAEIEEHGTSREIERQHGCSQATISVWARKHGLKLKPFQPPRTKLNEPKKVVHAQKPGVQIRGDNATVVSDPIGPYDLGDIDTLLRERGLNPDDWTVERVTVNEWDSYAGRDEPYGEPRVVRLRQLKVHLKRKVALAWLFPAVEVRERKPPKSTKSTSDTLAVICGDQQAGYHDEALHGAFVRWLADVKPDLGALTGDTLDLPTISRHPDRPHWNADPQECINAGYRLLSEYVDASPGTSWRKLRGNHDWRLEAELLTRAERMFGLAPADLGEGEQVPLYSIRRFLHLDALGIELVGREGEKWQLAELELVPGSGVYVRHQPPNEKKLTRLHRTVIAGDTHRQSLKQVTTWHGDEPHVITLVETGCLCEVRANGLGYADHPDWQQGFATVALNKDGSVGYDLAVWRDGTLTWRGETWKA